MKNTARLIVFIFGFVISYTNSNAQAFGAAGSCQDTKNANGSWASFLNDPKRAVFTYTSAGGGGCTGTLINQNVTQDNLQQLFVTAKHCIDGGAVNFNAEWDFYFNYQSPDGINTSVPDGSNVNGSNRIGSRYRHRSTVTVVDIIGLSDYAILKINKPIPPHYNVYYAGWTPYAGQALNFPLYDIHHPRRDIKKIAKTPVAVAQTAYSCYVVTEVFDVILNFLFGWAVKKEIHTRTVCSYLETPYYLVPAWSEGVVEPGSSGSALLNNDGKIIGTLSGGTSSCSFPVGEAFGRFHTSYNKSRATRDNLNPSAGWLPSSLGGRQITTYTSLPNLSGDYFPAGDYQPTNQIKLKASGLISTSSTAPLVIYNGADFIFESSQSITIRPGFVARAGSRFAARIVPPGQREEMFDPNQGANEMLQLLAAIDVPEEMAFDAGKYIPEFKGELGLKNYASVYPNPTKGMINVDLTFSEPQSVVKIKVLSQLGQEVATAWEENFQSGVVRINLANQAAGLYFVQVQADTHSFAKGVVLEK